MGAAAGIAVIAITADIGAIAAVGLAAIDAN
jgi:hypothetical protein